MSTSLARASFERMARFGVRPNRELGQNFLADDNILDVIGRTAELSDDDVVLEIGGGLGVLTEYLAERASHVHAVEMDRQLEPVLRDAVSGHSNTSVVVADVMDVDLTALDPTPRKVVANLPYGVAVPALVRTITELEAVTLWCVMVQREIADRLAAGPGSKTYGVPSVIAQLSCDVEVVRPISRSVFRPPPRVDSALVRLRRKGPAPGSDVRQLVHHSFAHRRKTLAGSLQIARSSREIAKVAREALETMGHPPNERAERLAPTQFVELARRLESIR